MRKDKIKAVIDTQLFLRAAANIHSLPAKIIFDLQDKYQVATSDKIIAEVRNVLNRPAIRAKFPRITDAVVRRGLAVLEAAQIVNPMDVPSISRDPKDDKFLACAKAAGAQYIVSEDKDLLVLNPHEGIQIVNALDFLRIIQTPETE